MVGRDEAWIGLDVGTTSSKAVVYDTAGRPVATGRTPTLWSEPGQPGWSEIAADVLLGQSLAALALAADATPAALRISGIGIAGMGETGVLVGAAGAVVAPSLAWHDPRDAAELEELRADIGEHRFTGTAGKPFRTQFSLTKHRWLVRHVPSAAAATRRFNVAEWVARGLGAGEVCDRSLACRTGWYDLAAGGWWDEALAWSGASAALMPDLVDSGTPIGTVRDVHPRLDGAVVTTAGHDHQAAALGAGATRTGDELDSSGTAEALVRTVLPEQLGLDAGRIRELARAGITTDVSIQPGRWSLLGGTEGGLTMQRALTRLGVPRDELAALDGDALALPEVPVRPVAAGTGARVLEQVLEQVDGGMAGVWRAVVEAVTGEALTLHEAITSATGPHNRLIATGGWCHSAMVLDAKRRAFGQVLVAGVAEAGTLGAATLAARAAGALGPDDVLGAVGVGR